MQVYCAIFFHLTNRNKEMANAPPPSPSLSLPKRSQHSGAENQGNAEQKVLQEDRVAFSPASTLSLSSFLVLSCYQGAHKGESIATKTVQPASQQSGQASGGKGGTADGERAAQD